MPPNLTSCFHALHSGSQKDSLLMLYPGIVCDLTMPLYVTQKEIQGTKLYIYSVMIHSLSNSRYLATNMLTSSYQDLGSFFNRVRIKEVALGHQQSCVVDR